MSMTIRLALAAAIVLSTVAAAWTAPRRQNVYRSSPRAQATVPRSAPFSNPDSPAATGGGNLGYNQNIYNWWSKLVAGRAPSEPERFGSDVSNAEVHVLDAGHFALDTKADEIATLLREFMKTEKQPGRRRADGD